MSTIIWFKFCIRTFDNKVVNDFLKLTKCADFSVLFNMVTCMASYSIAAKLDSERRACNRAVLFFYVVDFVWCNENADKILSKVIIDVGEQINELNYGRRGWPRPCAIVTKMSGLPLV